jgi:L-fuculose-phosphate aldolase
MSISSADPIRDQVLVWAQQLEPAGLSLGTSGNLSARTTDGMMVTPTARRYEELTAGDMVEVDLDGSPLASDGVAGGGVPSTEWPFHASIYRQRPETGAVVHAHPPYATALACHQMEIPPFHYMVAIAGGATIRCAGYAKPGSNELAAEVGQALEGRRACLLANHGLIALGASVRTAFELALEVENLSRQYWLALQVGDPVLLSGAQMDEILAHFETYKSSS